MCKQTQLALMHNKITQEIVEIREHTRNRTSFQKHSITRPLLTDEPPHCQEGLDWGAAISVFIEIFGDVSDIS